jgi:hypothetical protein
VLYAMLDWKGDNLQSMNSRNLKKDRVKTSSSGAGRLNGATWSDQARARLRHFPLTGHWGNSMHIGVLTSRLSDVSSSTLVAMTERSPVILIQVDARDCRQKERAKRELLPIRFYCTT